jgi:dUTP pyrophosphatase
MEIKFKKLHPTATIPTYAKFGDAGMDMTAVHISYTEDYIEYDTAIAVEIPEGYVGLLFPRSSNSKKDLLLCNGIGVVDSGYRNSVRFRYKVTKHTHENLPENIGISFNGYKIGERIGQLIILPFPKIEMIEVEELSDTERGTGGFGHSGS